MDQTPDLPALHDGITLLDGAGAFTDTVLDHLIIHGGTARWIEGRDRATDLARAAPNPALAGRIRVAGAATTREHAALVRDLPRALSRTDVVLVLPGFSLPYETADHPRDAEDLLHGALRALHGTVHERDVPALVTAPDTGGALHHVVAAAADRILRPGGRGRGRERSVRSR